MTGKLPSPTSKSFEADESLNPINTNTKISDVMKTVKSVRKSGGSKVSNNSKATPLKK
jgi:hypothetical protein